ncbi:MAG: hypothetical protein QF692_02600 [Alphaproteobacteria bacterium]|jgi:hypothetical membrane protein|nr:hypothetical protein [Alphaproteobacteria bacterium]MDP7222134.1 hypothetical protein [Alphaproteobacteria bacterium]
MSDLIYQWIDLFWIPIALIATHKGQRLISVVLILACALTMRTQIELMEMIGSDTGLINLMQSDIYNRGLIVYSIFIALFLIMAYFSPKTRKVVFFAASISLLIMAFCISSLLMAL